MGKVELSNLKRYQVSAITYDELLNIYDELHLSLKALKQKYSSLKKNFISIDKSYSITSIKQDKLKFKCRDLEKDTNKIECDYSMKLRTLTCENKKLEK